MASALMQSCQPPYRQLTSISSLLPTVVWLILLFLDGKYLALTSSETLLCAAEWRECCASAADALLTEARHCVSACCQLFSGKVANVCLKSCQKLSYDIID